MVPSAGLPSSRGPPNCRAATLSPCAGVLPAPLKGREPARRVYSSATAPLSRECFLCHRCTLNSVNSTPAEVAREGMEAWRRGDFETIERILDPNVEWLWFEPGDWDCHNRDDVMRVLRQRFEQGFAKGDLTFRSAGEDAVIVVAHPSEIGGPEWPDETATVMTFRDERVISMQDYRTESEALAAARQT
jgi:ketosteroid isomerase-like protein